MKSPHRILPFSKAYAIVALVLISLTACSDSDSPAASNEGTALETPGYTFSTEFRGEELVLTLVDAASGQRELKLRPFVKSDNQYWQVGEFGDGFFRLTNFATEETLALDVVNDGVLDKVAMMATGDVSGQKWRSTELPNGFCRLTNEFTGTEIALDISSDDQMDTPVLRAVGDFSGQHWVITHEVGPSVPPFPEFKLCAGAQ